MRSIHVGLSTIGQLVLGRALVGGLEPVAAIDISPKLAGRSLSDLIDGAPQVPIGSALSGDLQADVAFICTSSRLPDIVDHIEAFARKGIHVISTCEELAYPWRLHPELSARLDRVAKSEGIAIVGTGVNPGFVMDTLVIDLARVCSPVKKVDVERRVDVARRRSQLQRKAGVGLTPAEFRRRVESHQLGHVGLRQSAEMVADFLNLNADHSETSITPILANHEVLTPEGEIGPGTCLGVRETTSLTGKQGESVRMTLHFEFGLADPADRIQISGGSEVDVLINQGIEGDGATASIAVACAQTVPAVAPGLRATPELPVARVNLLVPDLTAQT